MTQILQTALGVEFDDHMGYEAHERRPDGRSNARNGTSSKTVHTDVGPVTIDVPRDRDGSFEPVVVPKHARRLSGFDEQVLSLYAKGFTCGDIVEHVAEIYGSRVSRDLVSRVTDAVVGEMVEWQNRPLDEVYPVIFIDALYVKIRDGQVSNRPIYVALGVNVEGDRDVLGMWAGDGGEGAKHWGTFRVSVPAGGDLVGCPLVPPIRPLTETSKNCWPSGASRLIMSLSTGGGGH